MTGRDWAAMGLAVLCVALIVILVACVEVEAWEVAP